MNPTTVTLALVQSDVYALLKELEALRLVRIVEPRPVKPSDFAGILSREMGDALSEYVSKSREEWERDIQ